MREWDHQTGPRGLRLRVCEWGDERGRVTVVAHGFLEQGAAWDRVATRLPGRVVAPDHRGHGLSEHVGRGGYYHFWDYVSDLDGLVRHLGAPVDLVGHSMGGTISVLFAATRPEAVRRLVLVEGLGPPDTTSLAVRRGAQFLDAMRDPPTHRPLADLEDGVRRVRRWNPRLPDDVARALVRRITRPVDGGLVWTWDPLHRSRSPRPFDAGQFATYLRAIRAPTLLVRGADSPWVLPDRDARAAAIPNAHAVAIPEAGHLLHHDTPDALAHAIRTHLEAP